VLVGSQAISGPVYLEIVVFTTGFKRTRLLVDIIVPVRFGGFLVIHTYDLTKFLPIFTVHPNLKPCLRRSRLPSNLVEGASKLLQLISIHICQVHG
jgi:hypothetical protein